MQEITPMTNSVPVAPGLFAKDEDDTWRLVAGYCDACTRHHFPRLQNCPYCSSENCSERLVGERGTLHLFTTVVNRPPGYRGEVPFGFGVVELPEGLRIISRLTESDSSRLHFGQSMRLVVTPLHEDETGRLVTTYAFQPEP
jgi:uncharacterized OB-fold protein